MGQHFYARCSEANLAEARLWKRWLWFIALWCAGVLAVTTVGFAIRWVLLG
ncbi:hypothetical protein [Idiomarina tyrosinivorans]|uniref:hypothetical protein n=1 Tax=Idiomarina tyrosinivorans TaxID=1445662 RepID=UPI0018E57E18|nr:hypothetical protein [Idiomarina tyrosinivorans]